MQRAATSLELRKRPRARLRLPVRIRWHGPLGMRLETTETIDASRDGLLVHRTEGCDAVARVWVAFPFDLSLAGAAQPETPAQIVRVEAEPEGGFRVALRFESPSRVRTRPAGRERRADPRVPFALPIFVRPAGTPWPEESMTQDISRGGARFESSHIYAAGDAVLARVPWSEWPNAGEIPGRVLRVAPMEDAPGPVPLANPGMGMSAIFTSVSVQWMKPGAKTGTRLGASPVKS